MARAHRQVRAQARAAFGGAVAFEHAHAEPLRLTAEGAGLKLVAPAESIVEIGHAPRAADIDGWLAHADPQTGLIPRNLGDSNFWNGRDSAADNYPFMVLTAAMTDRPLFQGRMLEMLRTAESPLFKDMLRIILDISHSYRRYTPDSVSVAHSSSAVCLPRSSSMN